MRRISRQSFLCVLATLLAMLALVTSCSDDDNASGGNSTRSVTTVHKILVIVPSSSKSKFERTAQWALDNIDLAQRGLAKKVKLELEWKNEDDADMLDFVKQAVSDSTYEVIIGPTRSTSAQGVAAICSSNSKQTLMLPIATSAELQRVYADRKNIWNFVESDITQCEMLLIYAKSIYRNTVSLLAADDDYGRSFTDWFAFQAAELGLTVNKVVSYQNEAQLRQATRELVCTPSGNFKEIVIFAPGNESDAIAFDEEIGKRAETPDTLFYPEILCSDMMRSPSLSGKLKSLNYEGFSPTADPASGFVSAYKSKFNEEPESGEPNVFDALLLSSYAFAARHDGESLDDAITRIVDVDGLYLTCSWMTADVQTAFESFLEGDTIIVEGTTGDWTFDDKNHSSVLNTNYGHWVLNKGKYVTLDYVSTDGGSHTLSSLQRWDQQAKISQEFDENQSDFTYPTLANKWAVVVSTSDTWANYRHQADALAMYQLLKRHGYDDDHILLVMEDNIAYNANNIHQGEVRVRVDGENLYHDVKVDYKLSDITISDLKKIMMGEKSDRLPNVISSTANDNVIVFWCGHGNYGSLAWGSSSNISSSDIRDILQSMSDQKKFRKMMFSIDACYSGSIGDACEGVPGVIFFSAAKANEKSKADMIDKEMGVWLSNGFTRAFQEAIDENPYISLRNLYYKLARQTVGSHATVYNAQYYGNIYRNTMEEYLGD